LDVSLDVCENVASLTDGLLAERASKIGSQVVLETSGVDWVLTRHEGRCQARREEHFIAYGTKQRGTTKKYEKIISEEVEVG
jgi:hypothetical protein